MHRKMYHRASWSPSSWTLFLDSDQSSLLQAHSRRVDSVRERIGLPSVPVWPSHKIHVPWSWSENFQTGVLGLHARAARTRPSPLPHPFERVSPDPFAPLVP